MLRPILAFVAICLAAFLLAPTVASVHDRVTDLDIKRPMPWQVWKWTDEPEPSFSYPTCDKEEHDLYSEVTDWPARIRKNESFQVGGIVREADTGQGVDGVDVDLFLNETKHEPGVHLTRVVSVDGRFSASLRVPFDLDASSYHLVAHAHDKFQGCKKWYEHWSDPEMDVTARTRFLVELPERPVVGHPMIVKGTLVDEVGAPVKNATVELDIEGVVRSARVETGGDGSFLFNVTPERPGNRTMELEFDGTKYYGSTDVGTQLDVLEEDVRFDDARTAEGIQLVRSEPESIAGRVLLANAREPGEVSITFDGLRVVTCDGCAPTSHATVEPAPDGTFLFEFHVPSSEEPGPFTVSVRGGGLSTEHRQTGLVYVPTFVDVNAAGAGFFSREYEGNVTLRDDAGDPVPGTLAVAGPEGWTNGTVDANGSFAVQGAPGCGSHSLQAFYNGSGHHMPSNGGSTVGVCGFLMWMPPWLLAIPWWVWPLAAVAPFVGLWTFRRLQDRFATTISRGPPIDVAVTWPDDIAGGIIGLGETAAVRAALHEPLPDGHRLRLGTFRDLQEVPLNADLTATVEATGQRLGELNVRAEILDPKGRVVTRRTAVLRVVRYAAEIERRYLALRRASVGEGSESVSPREFEAWLRERADNLEPSAVERLIGLFEEADYGPRDATRLDLVAYLTAEQTLPEVRPPAVP